MTVGNEVYTKLRQQIDKMPIGFPATESGVEIRILKQLFTLEEARIALNLNIIHEPIEKIYKRVRKTNLTISVKELENTLERLVKKGAITSRIKNGKKSYSYLQFAIGMYEYQVDHITKEFYQDCEEYLFEEFKNEFYKTKIPQLRPIPISKNIPSDHPIAIYDDIRNIIAHTEGEFSVMNCICKQGKDLVEQSCQVTEIRETCILFPNPTSYFRRFNISRPVSNEEVLQILDQAEEAGLVIQPGNSQEPNFICCCCGDCCGVLTMAKTYSKPSELFSSNYYAIIDPDRCNGCGSCQKRCQMEALVITKEKTSVNLDRCIGCGLCVIKCPNEAITLNEKVKITVPPKNRYNLYRKILFKKLGPIKTLKTGMKIKLGLKV
ncbi:MAG: 4Fe-4S binding protein [Candidatus Heimdallarchaeota archaeon]|nr:MAG: 4Fe-4S binding protein [Candidatus Heimdallarchaeota archaeon]